ncbi:MAG: hypothetical protein LIO53_04020, partial [Oscillospiraceae bacterium]|nr:hypothetical protein [Oscillospiraceae bacterium]
DGDTTDGDTTDGDTTDGDTTEDNTTEDDTTTDSGTIEDWDNSISISEDFEDDPEDGEGYAWNVTTTTDWGATNGVISLTANSGNDILTFSQGVGSKSKDIKMSFNLGTIKGFGQSEATWEMIFTTTDGTEMFKVRLVSGGWARTASLVVGDEVQATSYSFTDSAYTAISLYVSFGADGGKVTLGDVSADFETGSDLGTISVTKDSVTDWDRPYLLDDLTIQTVDKEKVTFNITSSEDGESVEGAVLTIGDDEYTVPASGIVEAYYLTGTYSYTLKLAKHNAAEGSFEVAKAGETVTVNKFTNIAEDVTAPVLINALYDSETNALKSVNVSNVTPENGEYVISDAADTEDGVTQKYMMWTSLSEMEPVGEFTQTSQEASNECDIELEYVGEAVPTKIVIDGGDEYIYLPESGTVSSTAFTATVYDNAELVMEDAEVEWTLPGQPDSISIDNGVITLSSEYPLTDDNGVDVTIRVTVKDTEVSEDTTIHIHNIARATTWDITGPAVIKDGSEAEYSVSNVKDQYGNDFTGENTYTLSTTETSATVDGMKITPNIGTSRTAELTLTVASDADATKTVDRTVTVYGYDYYEPGTVESTYGTPRMEEVNGVSSVVWPKSASANATTTITLPTSVELSAGSAKMITFDNIATTKTVGSQERSLTFVNSNGDTVISIDFAGESVVKDWSKVDGNYTGTEIGKLNALNESSSAVFVLKTDSVGTTSAVLQYNGSTLAEYEIGEVGDIAAYKLTGGNGAPDDRLLTLTNLIISDSDVAEVEIIGDDYLAKISGFTATKKFKGSIFSQSEGETFTWSVADADGNEISGVSIDQTGTLSVEDTVTADTVAVISYTSSLSTEESPKLATHEVTIKDFANVASFEIDGPIAVNAGDTVTYVAKNIVDEYGDTVTMNVTYALTEGEGTIATINSETGVVTTTGTLGSYTVSVTVGNPDKTMTLTKTATVANYSAVGDTTGDSVEVDVSVLANYDDDTEYLVTTATADGVMASQTETTATNGKVTVDTTNADKYEVSPIYSYSDVGNVASGKEIPLCDGLYDFTFKKSNGTRADIFVNGYMVGQNVDQYGKGRSTSGSYYTAKDVNVEGGSAVVTMKDNDSNMDSIVIKKAPTIVNRKTHVYILGDSLVANYYGTFADEDGDGIPTAGDAQTGWGQVFDLFVTDDMNVTNLAESGNYATGLQSSTFPSVLANAKSGDYMIMECGYNDKNYSSESAMATALEEIADDCAAAGITLILSTPNFGPARSDTGSANVVFGPKILEVAEEKGVLGVNLSEMGYVEYTAMTRTDKADYWAQNFNVYYDGAQQDNLHLSYLGAMKNASYVAQVIYDAQNDTENTELAEALAGLKINTQAYDMTDSEGKTITIQVTAE